MSDSIMHKMAQELVSSRLLTQGPFSCHLTLGHPTLAVMTGPNVSGKSLARKVLYHIHKDSKIEYIHTSQQARSTGGIMRAFMYGDEAEESTGYNSIGTLLGAFKTAKARTASVSILFDEPEIGCGEELQAAIGVRIAQEINAIPNLAALFVVTHSRYVVKQLLSLSPTHLRLGDGEYSLQEWCEREVTPVVSLESLRETGIERWRAVEKLLKRQ